MKTILRLAALSALLALARPHFAQSVTQPPSGWNQLAEVSQWIGLVKVTIQYHSPDVTGADGKSRKGEIWGKLVPYGLESNDFGTATQMPWRAGANENTVFTVSHDVLIQGEPLPAGSYGLHLLPMASGDWTLIFSKKYTAWGSYFYDVHDDALRVSVTPASAPYHEWLTYAFTDRQPAFAVAALYWEEKTVPFKIEVPNLMDLYVAQISKELENTPGFSYEGWLSAAQFCLFNNTHLEQGLEWIEIGMNRPYVSQKNFATLNTKAQLLMALNRKQEAQAVMDEAIHQPDASVTAIHQFGRQLQASGNKEKALEVFQYNAERYPNTWPVNVGLARGYSALGEYKKALKCAKLAQTEVPAGDAVNKQSLEAMVKKLEKGEDVN